MEITFSQETADNFSGASKLFLNSSIRANLTSSDKLGFGALFSVGYDINNNFSLILSSGYMTSHVDAYSSLSSRKWDSEKQDYLIQKTNHEKFENKIIPFDLTLQYRFNFLGVQPYLQIGLGWDYNIDNNYFEYTLETKYEQSGEVISKQSSTYKGLIENNSNGFSFRNSGGLGVLIPISNSFHLDLSYINTSGVYSFGAGFKFGLK